MLQPAGGAGPSPPATDFAARRQRDSLDQWLRNRGVGALPGADVPRIANRGRHLLEQIGDLLRHYGYAVAETTHDCGELGGLAQSRKRFLLVARHIEKVPPFLYEPDKKRLQAVGTVLDRMPLPGAAAGGPMHRIPSLQWKTWVRLAFVEAGCDWRSLNKLAVEDGVLRDFLIVPEYRRGYLGVNRWDQTMGTVQGESLPSNGAFSIADPRAPAGSLEYQQYGVCGWQETMGSVINVKSPGQGTFSIADPRRAGEGFGKYMVTRYDEAAGTVISGSTTGQGAYAVADPRPNGIPEHGDHYLTGGHYGVTRWDQSTGAVSSAACHDNGRWSVADPRMPKPSDKLVAVIRALDGTWHRPFTTLELAALQSLIEPEEYLELDGLSDSGWRERIGNAVPPSAAAAIAGVMGTTLLLAWSGETFMLSASPIWVRPVAVALSVVQGGAT
jgi:site-specific DNA-cytosine methylase